MNRGLVVIAFIIVCVLLLIYFHKRINVLLKGGEWPTFYINNQQSFVPTLSIIALDQCIGENILPTEDLDQIIKKCSEYAKRFTLIQMKCKGEIIDAYGGEFDTASRISDAHLDLIGIVKKAGFIKVAMAVNEWHEQEKKPESGELVTTYDGTTRLLKITRPDACIWTQAPFSLFIECTLMDDYDEIRQLQKLITEDELKLLASLKIKEPEAGFLTGVKNAEDNKAFQEYKNKMEILPWHGEEIINIMDAAKSIAKSERLINLVKATTPSVNSLKLTKLESLRTFYSTLDWFQYHPKNNITDVYLEYSYKKERAHELYEKIHMHTNIILQQIIDNCDLEGIKQVYAYRFKVTSDGPITTPSLKNMKNIKHVDFQGNQSVIMKLYIYDDTGYSIVQVPPTNEKISNDEQIYVHAYGNIYSIQIEHSESGGDHKSNFVEFLGRTLSRSMDIKRMRKIIKKYTKYLEGIHEKFQWKPKGQNVDLKTTRIYNAFNDLKDQIFEKNPVSSKP